MSSRVFFVGGNWKMNGSKKLTTTLLNGFSESITTDKVDIVVAPPAPYLALAKAFAPKNIQVSAQNCHQKSSGAFTAEIAPEMLADIGIPWVILGHSERRHIYKETNQLLLEKTTHALKCGLSVIFCVGETQSERENSETNSVLTAQLSPISKLIDPSRVVIAYEPVWAIGTGKIATPEIAEETIAWIRSWLQKNTSQSVSDSTRIIYGGSVKANNCAKLASCPNIDGFLVGGASLKVDSFSDIVNLSAAAIGAGSTSTSS